MNQAQTDQASNQFCLVVGRPYDTGTVATMETRMKTVLHDRVMDYLRLRNVDFSTATRAADLAVKDKLAKPGVEVVYLTSWDLAAYLAKAGRSS